MKKNIAILIIIAVAIGGYLYISNEHNFELEKQKADYIESIERISRAADYIEKKQREKIENLQAEVDSSFREIEWLSSEINRRDEKIKDIVQKAEEEVIVLSGVKYTRYSLFLELRAENAFVIREHNRILEEIDSIRSKIKEMKISYEIMENAKNTEVLKIKKVSKEALDIIGKKYLKEKRKKKILIVLAIIFGGALIAK